MHICKQFVCRIIYHCLNHKILYNFELYRIIKGATNMSEEMQDKEIKNLLDTVNGVQYNKKRFKVMIGEEKYLFGIISGVNSAAAPISKLMQYKTLYDTLKDLDYKIKISFTKAIEYAYSDRLDFRQFQESSMEETYAYYFIENALFRTSSLWDLLAQLYRLYYNIEIEARSVYYKNIFNQKLNYCDSFKDQSKEIDGYLKQRDDTQCQDEWKGNHGYANACRNKMTHRNSPNVASISDFDVNLKQHPAYMLKRIIEDYSTASKYIGEILNEIEKEVMEE